ncbi:MAG: hypothetical protein NTX56_07825 [Proteobacteria bacterium]|nr:hypothetical protein [Pseudomonadota bacterium]
MITALVGYLSVFLQTANLAQVEIIARSMHVATPDDIVALQFLGLVFSREGSLMRLFRFSRV